MRLHVSSEMQTMQLKIINCVNFWNVGCWNDSKTRTWMLERWQLPDGVRQTGSSQKCRNLQQYGLELHCAALLSCEIRRMTWKEDGQDTGFRVWWTAAWDRDLGKPLQTFQAPSPDPRCLLPMPLDKNSLSLSLALSLYIYIYIHNCVYIYIYIYIHTYSIYDSHFSGASARIAGSDQRGSPRAGTASDGGCIVHTIYSPTWMEIACKDADCNTSKQGKSNRK